MAEREPGNNTTHDRLDDIIDSLSDLTFEERMERVREIRRGRVMPSAKKPVRKAAAKSRGKKLDSLVGNMSAEEIAALKSRLQKDLKK